MVDQEIGGQDTEPGQEGPSREERTWALIGVLCPLANFIIPIPGVNVIAPLIVYLIKRQESDFIAFHSLQTVFFQIALLVIGSALALIGIVTVVGICLFGPLVIAVMLGAIAYQIIIAIKAYNGEWAEFWLVGEWARNTIGR